MKLKVPDKPVEEILTDIEAKGFAFEKTYHGCAQCVLGTLMEVFDFREPEAFKAATGLGGGIGLSIEGSCGALTGGVMAIGLLYGRELDKMEDPEKVRFTAYRLANRLQERFVREYGSSICKDIHRKVLGQSYHLNNPDEWQAFLDAGGHSDKCPDVVGKGARWAAEILIEEQGKKEK